MRQDAHVCLRDPCVYCLAKAGEALPASVLAEDPMLRAFLQQWDQSSREARQQFLRLLKHARTGRALRLTPPVRRTLVETYTYDRETVMRDFDRRPSPYRIFSLDALEAQLGQRADEFLPPPLADVVIDRVAYAWRHDEAPTVAATTLCRKDAAPEDFELEFRRQDNRIVLRKFHVVREAQSLLATILPVDRLGDPSAPSS